jgi:hypothetical protein
VASAVIFGFGHLYQGWRYVLSTAVLGVGLAWFYLITGSLLGPIIVHIALDLRVMLILTPARIKGLALVLLVAVTILAPFPVMATAQEPDWIRIDHNYYPLTTNPLDAYLKVHPDAMPKNALVSTARWRGYVAIWRIKNQRLFLTTVRVGHHAESKRGFP